MTEKKEPTPTEKQEAFAQAILIEDNASDAYRASYDAENMSLETINREATRLIQNPTVATRIAELKAAREEKTGIDAEWLLKRLAEEAQADAADLYEENGTLKPIHKWPKIWRTGLVAGIDTTQEYETIDGKKERVGSVTKIKVSDRVKRLELIGKHVDVQAFLERTKNTVAVTFPGLMQELYGDKPTDNGDES